MNTNIILISVLLLSEITVYAQATGFTLSPAVNLASPVLNESSGLEYCRGKLWTHNDSGGEPKIYAVDPTNGSITQTITLEAKNVDWEDLAADDNFLYIADTGNNANGNRTDLKIYKIKLDDIPATGDIIIPASKMDSILFQYPDQTSFSPAGNNNTAFDCEAILVHNDVIHLFTKDWLSEKSGSYKTTEYLIPNVPHSAGGKYQAEKFKDHSTTFLVTGADYADVNVVALIGYQSSGLGTHYVQIYSGFQGDDISTGVVYSNSPGTPLTLGQVEAICFGEDPFKGYISNEFFEKKDVPFFGTVTVPASVKPFTISYNNTPILVGTVTITGTARLGETLTAVTTGLSASPSGVLGALSYQWKRNDADIPEATGKTYTLGADDLGKTISVTVTTANCTSAVASGATDTAAAKTFPIAVRNSLIVGEKAIMNCAGPLLVKAADNEKRAGHILNKGILNTNEVILFAY
jgi:hypothetical protein